MEFKLKPGVPRLYTREDGKVAFHPKSVNAKEERFPAKFLIYNTKVKSTGVGGCVGQVQWSLVVCVCVGGGKHNGVWWGVWVCGASAVEFGGVSGCVDLST